MSSKGVEESLIGSPLKKTDWDAYYKKPYKAASITRKITASRLVKAMNKYKYVDRPSILEIGGANSCFYEVICDQVLPVTYSIFDNNVLGLQKFRERISNLKEFSSELIQGDILNPQYQEKFDIVFSVGLIEHFDMENTRKAFLNHLQFVKSPGVLIVTFPTPTFLYRITRFFAECLDMWIFHDERPIQEPEIRSLVPSLDYNIRDYSIIWPIILTQGMIVITKV